MAANLAGRAIDGVFTSPLGRATATAEVYGSELGVAVTVIDQLAEVHQGDMAGLTAAEIDRTYPGELARRSTDRYAWRFPGGESYADANRRAAVALQEIIRHRASRPLIVSHEMIGRMLLRNLVDIDAEIALGWNHPHDIAYEVRIAERTIVASRARDENADPDAGRRNVLWSTVVSDVERDS